MCLTASDGGHGVQLEWHAKGGHKAEAAIGSSTGSREADKRALVGRSIRKVSSLCHRGAAQPLHASRPEKNIPKSFTNFCRRAKNSTKLIIALQFHRLLLTIVWLMWSSHRLQKSVEASYDRSTRHSMEQASLSHNSLKVMQRRPSRTRHIQ